ncbi:MAG TPA: type II toxin-antitoxin system PemK/MazF family toxin [Acidimicrobiales bacterium]|nr:type II toxin-antitoxin system PemK/MazF family toxin [Acidimicrobiales bacterium]
MLSSGDVIDLDLGLPEGREAGFLRPAVVVTAQRILDALPSVIQAVPLTTSIRGLGSEVTVRPDPDNGLAEVSSAQCQHVRAVSSTRVRSVRGNVGAVALGQIRETIAVILDLLP